MPGALGKLKSNFRYRSAVMATRYGWPQNRAWAVESAGSLMTDAHSPAPSLSAAIGRGSPAQVAGNQIPAYLPGRSLFLVGLYPVRSHRLQQPEAPAKASLVFRPPSPETTEASRRAGVGSSALRSPSSSGGHHGGGYIAGTGIMS